MDLVSLTATEASRRIRSGALDAADLLEAYIDQVYKREPQVRALAWFDADAARRAVGLCKEGPLAGIPIGVKDVLDTADAPTEANSPIWTGNRPRMDAACVALAREAGGYIFAKTVTTEFAIRTPGPTTNPYDHTRTPGGSSSGSAAGIAAQFFPLAFGTQTAGSTIRPAAFCGVVGFKPTFGLINRAGLRVMSDSLDTIAVMGRSVADCALLAGAASRRDLGDPETRIERAPKVGIYRSFAWPEALPETHAMMERVASALSRAGASISDWEAPDAFADILDAHTLVQFYESAQSLSWELAEHRGEVSQALLTALDEGLATSPDTCDAMRLIMRRLQDNFSEALGDCDILVTPPAPGEAPVGIGKTGGAAFNKFWSALHVPCVTVPAGFGPNGLPLGIQIVARRGKDREALAWAQWVAAAIG